MFGLGLIYLTQLIVCDMHRYLAEFVMRWNMKDLREADRIDTMLESTNGLRLTYRGLIA